MAKLSRREAREAIIGLLFEREFRPEDSAEEIFSAAVDDREIPCDGFVKDSYFGILENLEDIDKMIGEHASGWKISRMNRVSRAIARLCVYEMMYCRDIPVTASLNEAIELAKKYDDDKARAFLNGVLNGVKESIENKSEKSGEDVNA